MAENLYDTIAGLLRRIDTLEASLSGRDLRTQGNEPNAFAAAGELRLCLTRSIPDGWIEITANGAELSRADYAALYAKVGDLFGQPANINVFQLPTTAQLPTLPDVNTCWIIRT